MGDNTQKLKEIRDILDGAITELEDKDTLIESLQGKIKTLNDILAREVQLDAREEGRMANMFLEADPGMEGWVQERLRQRMAKLLAEKIVQDRLLEIEWSRIPDDASDDVILRCHGRLRVIRPAEPGSHA